MEICSISCLKLPLIVHFLEVPPCRISINGTALTGDQQVLCFKSTTALTCKSATHHGHNCSKCHFQITVRHLRHFPGLAMENKCMFTCSDFIDEKRYLRSKVPGNVIKMLNPNIYVSIYFDEIFRKKLANDQIAWDSFS